MIGDTVCCGRPAVAGSAVAAEYGCGAFATAVAAAACAFKKEKRKKEFTVHLLHKDRVSNTSQYNRVFCLRADVNSLKMLS